MGFGAMKSSQVATCAQSSPLCGLISNFKIDRTFGLAMQSMAVETHSLWPLGRTSLPLQCGQSEAHLDQATGCSPPLPTVLTKKRT